MGKNSVLIVAAHPDDEILGCGGTIAWHIKNGDTVAVLIMADGITSRSGGNAHSSMPEVKYRQRSAFDAANVLGVQDLTFLSYPDNRMDTVAQLDVVRDIEKQLDQRKPNIVYSHHSGDVNVDHRIVHDAVIVACRPQPGNSVRRLLFFEIMSSTEWQPAVSRSSFHPNWFIDISQVLDLKLEALVAYKSELREFPHPRSLAAVEHLSRWRGATVGVPAAEAFELGRYVQ